MTKQKFGWLSPLGKLGKNKHASGPRLLARLLRDEQGLRHGTLAEGDRPRANDGLPNALRGPLARRSGLVGLPCGSPIARPPFRYAAMCSRP